MPDNWIDISAGIRNVAELKVVEYVLRHTWGYREYGIKKQITVDEFIRGRKRRDGSRMDRGTGLSEQSVRNGLEAAKRDGYIDEFVDDSDKARIKKYYGLRMRADAAGEAEPVPDHEDSTDASGDEVQSLDLRVQALDRRGPEIRPRTETNTKRELFEEQRSTIASDDAPGSESALPARQGITQVADDDQPVTTARIQAVMAELSRTFGDEGHRGSNTAQAMNLFLGSGISVTAFEQQLYQASAITRDEVHRRQHSGEREPIQRQMAFFFAVLRDLLTPEDADTASPSALQRTRRAA